MEKVQRVHLSENQAKIAASFLSRYNNNLSSVAPFADLIEYFTKLKVSTANVNKLFKQFEKSAKVIGSNKKHRKWSKVALVRVVASFEELDLTMKMWKLPAYMNICSNDPENAVCWSSQGNVASLIKENRIHIGELKTKLSTFYDVDTYKYNDDLLYLDDGWTDAVTDDGLAYIGNEDESLWLDPTTQAAISDEQDI